MLSWRFKTKKTSVADILEGELSNTIHAWLKLVEEDLDLALIPLNFDERTGHLPRLLKDVITRLRLDKDTRSLDSVAASHHGKLRYKQGYTLGMLVDESRILEVCIFSMLDRNQSRLVFSKLLPSIAIIADEVDAQLKQHARYFLPDESVQKKGSPKPGRTRNPLGKRYSH